LINIGFHDAEQTFAGGYLLHKFFYCKIGAKPWFFWFCLFSYSFTLPLSHCGNPTYYISSFLNRMIQTRGRARKPGSRFVVLADSRQVRFGGQRLHFFRLFFLFPPLLTCTGNGLRLLSYIGTWKFSKRGLFFCYESKSTTLSE
jgi:hypothetical protein